jgi:prepilin-type N-terminal cleavage/methylation domain-containing protein
MNRPAFAIPARRPRGGFTLAELLVVMGVIGVLSTLTLVSFRAIARDARMSSATNTLMAALDNARALAMKRNRPVLVAFYPRLEGTKTRVDVITAASAGDGAALTVDNMPDAPAGVRVFDRFRPVPDLPVRSLPAGIKIAGPAYGENRDDQWANERMARPDRRRDVRPGRGDAPEQLGDGLRLPLDRPQR